MKLNRQGVYNMRVPKGATEIINILELNKYEAYLVGGCVRDMFLRLQPKDWDICTNASPQDVLALFEHTHKVIPTGLQHGTVTVLSEGTPYEVTTYRIDGEYEDHRRPATVQFTSNLIEDLARRDFTVNAMAYNPEVGVVDPFGGIADIEAKVIRCVGRPEDRFSEDSLRILRALRLASTKGFKLEEATNKAILELYQTMAHLSAERVLSELLKLLQGDHVYSMLMDYPEVITFVLPELKPMLGCQQKNPHHRYDVYEHTCDVVARLPKNEVLKMAGLFHDAGKPATKTNVDGVDHFYGHQEVSAQIAEQALRRLKASNALIEGVLTLIRHHDAEVPNRRSVRRMVNKIGKDRTSELLDLKEADAMAQSFTYLPTKLVVICNARRILSELEAEEACFGLKDLAVNGKDLMDNGFKQGKLIGETLKYLLDKVLDEVLPNDREVLLREATSYKNSKVV